MEYIKSIIRDIHDFPTKGVIFKDLTTVFKDPRGLHMMSEELAKLYRDKGVTKVIGIESRGFIFGSILANELGAGFVPARKPRRHNKYIIRQGIRQRHNRDPSRCHHRR